MTAAREQAPETEVVQLRHGLTAVLVLRPTCPMNRRPCQGCDDEQRSRCEQVAYLETEPRPDSGSTSDTSLRGTA